MERVEDVEDRELKEGNEGSSSVGRMMKFKRKNGLAQPKEDDLNYSNYFVFF